MKHKASETILGGGNDLPPNHVEANVVYSPRFKVSAYVDVAEPAKPDSVITINVAPNGKAVGGSTVINGRVVERWSSEPDDAK